MRRRGFTLLEIVLVLLIVSIIASAVVVKLQSPLQNARLEDVVGWLGQFDRITRTYAHRQDRPVRMIVDLDKRQLRRMDSSESENLGPPLQLPARCRIDALRLPTETLTRGSIAIVCSTGGLMPTYAFRLVETGGRSRWLLVAGLTGHVTTFDDEDRFNKIWEGLFGRDAG
ncbi:hypothetical protein LCGC14_0409240 [marine sediment metagenome]|uniref:Prepilin-type N-terminal cleavage/methylation domain-containing protein n=1 Tax=marine sediment metagenome TaxID=412755 RepID=A0A0F9T026_9ZZZZ|nr:prepilin-type N-terminal cleavage/methylation domain-containing protein [Phycisphaerae bacterium]HDZ44312.1 prepilin-type N-terminal cleavage/methylation domain-containing protein [Phycisphaerae bacterium]